MKGYLIAIIFIIGLGLGVVGMIYGPDLLEPYMPGVTSMGFGSGEPVQGKVVGKLPRADKLLITVSTTEGASLVTFSQKLDEISLLVDVGDIITLKMGKYEPFVMNPTIIRVMKEGPEFSGSMSSPDVTMPSSDAPQVAAPQPKMNDQQTDAKEIKPESETLKQPGDEKEGTQDLPAEQEEQQI